MRQKYLLWALVAAVIAWFLSKSYPLDSSPFWPWNWPNFINRATVQQQGAGYGSADEEF
jgi:hypothetical protein